MAYLTSDEFFALFRAATLSALIGSPYANFPVKQAFQKKESADPINGIYFYRQRTEQYGFQDRQTTEDPGNDFILNESQWLIDHIHVISIVEKVISTENTVSGFDVIAFLGMVFNSTAWIDRLKVSGLSVLRIKEVTSNYFSNDFSFYNQYPALEVQVCYKQTITTTVPWATVDGETIAV